MHEPERSAWKEAPVELGAGVRGRFEGRVESPGKRGIAKHLEQVDHVAVLGEERDDLAGEPALATEVRDRRFHVHEGIRSPAVGAS